MALSRDEIYQKVKSVLVDALSVDDEDVKPNSTIRGDLGAESLDVLDIVFRLEKAFTTDPTRKFIIPRGDLVPDEKLMENPDYVQAGKLTPMGLAELKKKMPYSDFTTFDQNPGVDKLDSLFTVDTLVKYLESKLK